MVYVQWDHTRWTRLRECLTRQQAKSREAEEGSDAFCSLPGSRGQWLVHSTGCRLGGERGPLMAWRLERDGVQFGLADRRDPHETLVSGFVRLTGDVLLAAGGDARPAWALIVQWFTELGATITRAIVSRVDGCVDLPGVGVEEFTRAFREDRVITRTKKQKEHIVLHKAGRVDTGVEFGTGKTSVARLRVYNKALECQDLATRAWLIHRRWFGVDCDKAARVEFQLRRDFLKATKCAATVDEDEGDVTIGRPAIDTVEDYFEHRAALYRYLVRKWVRFVEPGHDARHTERARTMPIWDRVAASFERWAGAPEQRRYYPLVRQAIDIDSLIRQARGCFIAAAALRRQKIDGTDDFLGFCVDELAPHVMDDPAIPDRVKARTMTVGEVIDQEELEQWPPSPVLAV